MTARTRDVDKPRAAAAPSLEQRAACTLLLAALCNCALAAAHGPAAPLSLLEALSACALAFGVDALRSTTTPHSPWPFRGALGLLGLRWLDSCGRLAMAVGLSAAARFATIVAQATVVAGAGLTLFGV